MAELPQTSSSVYVVPVQEDRQTNCPSRRVSLPSTIYVDIPESVDNVVQPSNQRRLSRQLLLTSEDSSQSPFWTHERVNDTCIELPGPSQSSNRPAQQPAESMSPGSWRPESSDDYVEQTIFYDPFDDRTIEVAKEKSPPRPQHLPLTCNHQQQTILSPSNLAATYSSTPYTQSPTDDGFHLTPLPVSDTPEPPPAYTEIDTQPDNTVSTASNLHLTQAPVDGNRKLLTCPFCRQIVNTLVVRESGPMTHCMAVLIFCFCFFMVFFVYCLNICKYKNHYCPNCNQLIGYEIPILCTEMVYSRSTDQTIVTTNR